MLNILQALDHEALFAPHFRGDTWQAWRAFLAALFALPLTEAECAIYQHHTGRAEVPTMPFKEAALVVGRRGGKSRMLALVATHGIDLSLFRAMGGSGLINFDGTCKDDSGLIGVSFECRREVTERFGIGQRFSPPTSQVVSGNLFTFSLLFSQAGTCTDIYLERALASFVTGPHTFTTVDIPFAFTSADPIAINVTAAATVPEPATCAVLGVGLLGLASARRRKQSEERALASEPLC